MREGLKSDKAVLVFFLRAYTKSKSIYYKYLLADIEAFFA